jgi:trimethylamine--corrinoid protein Co-methyltransferase
MELKIPYSTILSQTEMEEVHENSLKILENVGVSTDSDAIINLCEDGGARIDHKSRRIRISREMVENALNTTPPRVTIYGRDPSNDMTLEDGKVYFGFGGTGVSYIRDLETGKIVVPKKKDVEDGTRLGDALPGISYMMVLASACDCNPDVQFLHELDAKFNNTTKPIVHPAPGAFNARKVLEIAEVVSGGTDELKDKPLVTLHCNTPSPLFYSKDNENIIEFARVKAPLILIPSPILAATGPGTMIGSFSSAIAESLFGIVLSQLVCPGAPIILGTNIVIMDMRTTRACYGAIEWAMGRIMTAQMARFYGIPSHGQGGCCDAKVPDAQAGAESFLTALTSAQSGNNMIQNVGTMAGGSLGSFELAVINDEIIGMIEYFLKGVDVSPEKLAYDVVNEIGPEGQFLSHDHTLAFFKKELFFPNLFDRHSEREWLEQGERSVLEKANERAKEIIYQHKVTPLSGSQQSAIKTVIGDAEKELAIK